MSWASVGTVVLVAFAWVAGIVFLVVAWNLITGAGSEERKESEFREAVKRVVEDEERTAGRSER